MTDPLDSPALDGSPAQAYASHMARANGIARFFAQTHPLSTVEGEADENRTIALLAHLHAAFHDPSFAVGGSVSRDHIPSALRRLNRGDGLVGTRNDYDMALKGLMTVACRYPQLLGDGGVDFILNELVPGGIRGGHPPEIEIVEVTFLDIDIPETENHLLMIESSRYLVNQLLHDRTGSPEFLNSTNGLSRWLLGYMQTIAKHDFLEFNSRPYARLSLHTLYNLHEFAREPEIRTAAQILLDYTMVKFAVSSNRGRRVSPFRRLQHRINHHANGRNDLYSDSGDPVAAYFMAYTGFVDPEGRPGKFPPSLTFNALISGTAAYRPPPAAYILSMQRDNPPSLHRFYHGTRPQLRGSPDIADGGLEMYYHCPSFLLSAGGAFLNSGYGRDEIDIGVEAWEQTSRAQATTLIPTRVDTRFHDLIRFEPYPDPLVDPYADDPEDPDTVRARAVNIGLDRGVIAGANLRPAEKKTILEHTSATSPALGAHGDRLLMVWKGSGNDNLNVGKVLSTTLLGIDGVEGVEEVVTLADTTDASPAVASHKERVFLAWKGSGNEQLNLAFSEDNGRNFSGARTFTDESDFGPALVSHGGRLLFAWTGVDEQVNVAKVNTGAGGGGWNADWVPTPGQAVFDRDTQHVAALSRKPGHLDLFVIGFDNHVWTTFWSEATGWNADWFPVPGQAVFDRDRQHVAAVSRHQGHLDLFVIGFDNHVWTTFWSEATGWNADWFPVPGQAVFDRDRQHVVAVSRHQGHLDLFVIGFDNHVWTTFWGEAAGWNADWFPVPGQAVFDRDRQHVAAVSRHQGHLDLFVIGFDNHVWTTFWSDATGWNTDWFTVPGQAVFDRDTQHVVALSRHQGHLDLFVIGFDNHVWTTFWSEATGWNADWFPTPGQAVFDRKTQRVAAVSRHQGHLDLFVIGFDNHVWTTFWSEATGWNADWFPTPGLAVFDRDKQRVAAVSRHQGQLDLFVIGFDNHVWTTFWARFGIEGLEDKVVLGETSDAAPALASHGGRLFLAWKGSGNDNLNLMFSDDNGATFRGKTTFPEASSHGPALTSHDNRLFLAWKGSGNENLNVARVVLFGNTAGGFGIEGLERKVVLGEISEEPPALGSQNGMLFLAWKGEGDDHLNLRVSRDGAFQVPAPWMFSDLAHLGFYVAAYRTPPAMPEMLDPVPDNLGLLYAMEVPRGGGWNADWFPTPGQAVFDRDTQHVAALSRKPGQLDLFVIGFDNHVWTTFWNEATGWNADWFPVPGQAVFDRDRQHVVAVSRHQGHLDLFVIGFDNHVWTTFWSEATGWNADWFSVPGQAVFDRDTQRVAAVSRHQGHLDLFVIGFDNHVWTTFWSDATGWNADWFTVPGQAVFDRDRQHVVALSRHQGHLDLFVIGFDNHVWTTFWSEATGWNADWFPTPGQAVFDRNTQHVAAVSRHQGHLDLFVVGFDNHVWTTFWSEATGWNPDWFPTPGQANFDRDNQQVVAVSRHQGQLDLFMIGFDDHVWTTFWTEPLTFEVFKRETLARNTTLPAQLENGGRYVFHAPDGKRFAIWLAFTELKYTARVVDLNDPDAVGELNTLPLVSGEYMRSVGGHSGLIEIRHPGCDRMPLVLDYRNAERPMRSDDRSACQGPWVERAHALFAIAKMFEEQQRDTDARAALMEAVRLYDELLRMEPEQNGPQLASAVVSALDGMGVDFSVPEQDLRDWLAGPLYTPYPAISQALLRLGKRLKAPVFLDVIVWNYEHTPGVASPRTLADVKLDVLKAAILEGSNIRHGTNVSDFEHLLA